MSGRTAWFHCFAGVAGDMALASLLDAGADESEVRAALGGLAIDGWTLEVSPVRRGGLVARRAEVRVERPGPPRTLPDLLGLVGSARLPRRAAERCRAAFELLARVEGGLHGEPATSVHFHEVGAEDAVVDIVGTMVSLELLDVAEVASSPVAMGTGTVTSAHGTLPNPSPAVLALLAGAPLYGREVPAELTTPTGAAILAATGATFGPLPALTVEAVGYGAGARELDGLPNCTQVVVGSPAPAHLEGEPLVELSANLDDATGEELADAVAALLAAGASDAWITPVVMKKGRPGHVVSVLASLGRAGVVARVLTAQTGSLGVRSHLVERQPVARRHAVVDLAEGPVRVKLADGIVKVEHDDAAAIAALRGVPLRAVLREVERRAFAGELTTSGGAGAGSGRDA